MFCSASANIPQKVVEITSQVWKNTIADSPLQLKFDRMEPRFATLLGIESPERSRSTDWARFRKLGHCSARVEGRYCADRAPKWSFSDNGRSGTVVGQSGVRMMKVLHRARTDSACRAGGDNKHRRCCKYLSHPTDACRSVDAERDRGSLLRSSSSHPVPSLRTTPALFSRCSLVGGTSVPPLWRSTVLCSGYCRPQGRFHCFSRGQLGSQVFHWISSGCLDPAHLRCRPSGSAGEWPYRSWRCCSGHCQRPCGGQAVGDE